MIYKYSSETGSKHIFDDDGVLTVFSTEQIVALGMKTIETKTAIDALPAQVRAMMVGQVAPK